MLIGGIYDSNCFCSSYVFSTACVVFQALCDSTGHSRGLLICLILLYINDICAGLITWRYFWEILVNMFSMLCFGM